ncbi:hypothetical protein KI387_026957, partial [Taxus chinensis]
MPEYPTPLENVEESKDEEMKDGEEGENEVDETVQETSQSIAEQATNLDAQAPKGPRSKIK